MSYDSQRASASREHIYIVEIEQDYCPLESGVGLCTATETGDDKCYQTFSTCNDLPNYRDSVTSEGYPVSFDEDSLFDSFKIPLAEFVDWADLGFTQGVFGGAPVSAKGFDQELLNRRDIGVVSLGSATLNIVTLGSGLIDEAASTDHVVYENKGKTYRFCQPRSPHPIAIDAIPSLKSVSLAPSKIDYTGGLGERSSVSLTFNDHPHNDDGIDKYVDERSYIATDRGTFWTKFRARNPNYQFRSLRVLTGYLENGEYKEENFKTRHYVIEKLEVSGGECRITAKDPLKLASAKKAQVPIANSGKLSGPITDTETDPIPLAPTGIGDAEYAASGWVTIGGSEICSFTRAGDNLTLVRGQYNTEAIAHDADATVQQCYQATDKVDVIVADIMINFAGIDSFFINAAEWRAEVSEKVSENVGLDNNLSGIIAKPTDVNKILKELSEAAPYSLYWDEFNQKLAFEVLKEPPLAANVTNMNDNILSGSFKTQDKPELRASTVYYTFGMIDPTKSLTDLNNFTQTVVRTDTDSINKYDSNQVKSIVSRWITSGGKALAENAAQLYGRRFSDIPREISFSLDAKDNSLNIGSTRSINHRDITDPSGLPKDTIFQVISRQEAGAFKYKALEYTFGDVLASDNDLSSNTIKISIDERNLNLYDRFVEQIGTPTGSTTAVFEVESGVIVGSANSSTASMMTGTWPSGATITVINKGFIVGKGGDGGESGEQVGTNSGGDGGNALSLAHDMTLDNFGIVGGGGGGGDRYSDGSPAIIFGGGGAGDAVGLNGISSAGYGSTETGGPALRFGSFPPQDAAGGDLGEDSSLGGSAGKAADLNGFTLTYDESDPNIRGDVS